MIAIIVNVGTQDTLIRFYMGSYSVILSIIAGTAMGLIVKYILDKKYIFCFQIKSIRHDFKTFVLYVIMGLLTTLVFWGFEFLFDYLFKVKEMRYIGGILGLTIGYVMKYFLDKKFVFIEDY